MFETRDLTFIKITCIFLLFGTVTGHIALLHIKLKQDQGKKQMSSSLSSELHPVLVHQGAARLGDAAKFQYHRHTPTVVSPLHQRQQSQEKSQSSDLMTIYERS